MIVTAKQIHVSFMAKRYQFRLQLEPKSVFNINVHTSLKRILVSFRPKIGFRAIFWSDDLYKVPYFHIDTGSKLLCLICFVRQSGSIELGFVSFSTVSTLCSVFGLCKKRNKPEFGHQILYLNTSEKQIHYLKFWRHFLNS
jgi:hypothetical protein